MLNLNKNAIIDKLREKEMTQQDLAKYLGITPQNLNRLLSGESYEKLWELLGKMFFILGIDVDSPYFVQTKHKKIIPMFLDYSGTTDKLIEGDGALDNIFNFMLKTEELAERLSRLDQESEYEIRTYIITGSSRDKAKAKIVPFYQLARREGYPQLFAGVIAEYCGYEIDFNPDIPLDEDIKIDDPRFFTEHPLVKNPKILEENREKIAEIIQKYVDNKGQESYIATDVTSMFNIQFSNITREQFDSAISEINQLLKEHLNEIDIVPYFDEYGIECDLKSPENRKSNSVAMIVNRLLKEEGYDIPLIIIGGDSKETDIEMYTSNKEKLGINSVFLAPSNIGELSSEYTKDPNIIKADWENVEGIIGGIELLLVKLRLVKKEGGISSWEVER